MICDVSLFQGSRFRYLKCQVQKSIGHNIKVLTASLCLSKPECAAKANKHVRLVTFAIVPTGAFVEGIGKQKNYSDDLIARTRSPSGEKTATNSLNAVRRRAGPWRRSPQEHPGNLQQKFLLFCDFV
jgi:hypothetical protein